MSLKVKAQPPLLRPLPDGGTIGIFSPSSPVDPERLDRGVAYLEKLGYHVHLAPTCFKSDAYIAGSGQERAKDLMDLVNSSAIDAIFCSRGGFGSIMMLPYMDFDAIRRARKMIVGFSDVTALQWAIWKKCGLPSVSAGMPGTDMAALEINPDFEALFWEVIKSGTLNAPLPEVAGENRTITGWSLPGTVSVGAMILGSDYFPDSTGAVMVLEDVDEPKHKVEAYLQQYRLAGVFGKASAIVLGAFTPAKSEPYPEVPDLETIFERVFADLGVPVFQGFGYGHIPGKISLPVGVPISVSLGRKSSIQIKESFLEP